MSQPQHDDQHEAKPMEHTLPPKQSILSCDPAVLAILLVFVLFFSALLPSAWPLLVGATLVGLAIRWGVLWYDRHREKR
ncbi:MAG: hypothetical protein QJT81_20220 [Candidatus Thiothrix putei]|uniref:Uncharacterized protein n=1 Tax=Candidatus Thiothrix putei TaxID=3080811 RepID=A0AA95HBA7_9GAMM|nr:MAG: hypothetical protein QJT81_20220 [Candidatus Thiothrix putei]